MDNIDEIISSVMQKEIYVPTEFEETICNTLNDKRNNKIYSTIIKTISTILAFITITASVVFAKDISNFIRNVFHSLSENKSNVLLQEDAIEKGYFVYNCLENKVYNKKALDRFIDNTKLNSLNRTNDNIVIVIYNMNNEPIIYYLFYDVTINEYSFSSDHTRVTKWESPKEEINDKEMIDNIISNDNIPGEYYEIEVVEDTDFNVAIILLKAYNTENNKYQDIEITRYMLDAEIVEDKYEKIKRENQEAKGKKSFENLEEKTKIEEEVNQVKKELENMAKKQKPL